MEIWIRLNDIRAYYAGFRVIAYTSESAAPILAKIKVSPYEFSVLQQASAESYMIIRVPWYRRILYRLRKKKFAREKYAFERRNNHGHKGQ